jgi:signal transduction histidine kinase
MRAATWTAQRVVSSARLLNPFNWRRRAGPRGLQREILKIRAAEQRRIGQDLHDGVGQVLSGVAFMSRALERKLADEFPDGAEGAAQIAEIMEEAMARTRSMVRVLNPVELSAGGLTSALGEMASDFEKVFGVSCTFEHEGRLSVNDAAATHLYRIAQEAATNAVRHGGAKHVVIGLSSEGKDAALTVQDDGTGFAVAETEGETVGSGEVGTTTLSPPRGESRHGHAANGMGLRIMECRAKEIGGSLSIRRRPEGGTVLTCAFPPARRTRRAGSEG